MKAFAVLLATTASAIKLQIAYPVDMNSAQIELSNISDSDREATLSQYDAYTPRCFNDLKTKFVQCDSV